MAKKRKQGKGSKAAVAEAPWTTLAGGIVGNVIGQVISESIASYLDGNGQKKKSTKVIRKLIKQVISRRGF